MNDSDETPLSFKNDDSGKQRQSERGAEQNHQITQNSDKRFSVNFVIFHTRKLNFLFRPVLQGLGQMVLGNIFASFKVGDGAAYF